MKMVRQRCNSPWLASAVMAVGWCVFDATVHVALSDPPSRTRIGVDDDSVRPLAQNGRPRASPPRLPKPMMPKGRIGMDDDSFRPVLLRREPPVRR
jgi:hypothetical protein